MQLTDVREQAGLDAHVLQPLDRAGRVVRVDGGEHEVTGHAGLDRDPGRLLVADLADEQHVGIGAQDRSQPAREREPALRALISIWLIPRIWSSTGSSIVITTCPGSLSRCSAV